MQGEGRRSKRAQPETHKLLQCFQRRDVNAGDWLWLEEEPRCQALGREVTQAVGAAGSGYHPPLSLGGRDRDRGCFLSPGSRVTQWTWQPCQAVWRESHGEVQFVLRPTGGGGVSGSTLGHWLKHPAHSHQGLPSTNSSEAGFYRSPRPTDSLQTQHPHTPLRSRAEQGQAGAVFTKQASGPGGSPSAAFYMAAQPINLP